MSYVTMIVFHNKNRGWNVRDTRVYNTEGQPICQRVTVCQVVNAQGKRHINKVEHNSYVIVRCQLLTL